MDPHPTRRRLAGATQAAFAACVLAASLNALPAFAANGNTVGTATQQSAGTSRVKGTATYRERVALTPAAVFEAVLEDVSRAGAAAIVIGRTRIENPGQVPIRFEIAYDHRKIAPDRIYAVRTTIRERGRLAWTSDARHAVLTHSNPNSVDILMRRATGPVGGGEEGTRERGDRDRGDRARPPATLSPLPALFTGMLPCADCMGIQDQLNL